MKVGVVHFMAYPETMGGEGPIVETLQKIAEDHFFTAVELSWVRNKRTRGIVKCLLEASYLSVAYVAHPRLLLKKLDLSSFDSEKREKAIEEMKIAVDEAYEMGAKGCVFLSGGDPGKEKRKGASECLVDSIKRICRYAELTGHLDLILEIFDREIDKKCLIGPTGEAVRVAEQVRREYGNFGLLVDLSHIPLLGEAPEDAILPAKDYLMQAHLGNCVRNDTSHFAYGDQHPRFGLAGGENDVEKVKDFLKVLLEAGFLNEKDPPIVSFEIRPRLNEQSEVVIAGAKRVLRQAWERL